MTREELATILGVYGNFVNWSANFIILTLETLINEATLWFLQKKKEAYAAINAWLDSQNAIVKLFVVFTVSGAIIFGIAAIQFVITRKIKFSGMIAAARNLTDAMKLQLYWNLLKAAWTVVTTLDERFAKLHIFFIDSMEAINETFGLPIGFLSGLVESYRVYVTSLYAMVGLPATDARIDFVTNLSNWLKKADDGFKEYAMHPGKLVDLLLSLAIQADPTTAATINKDIIANVAALNTTLTNFGQNYDQLRGSFDRFISSFPTEVRMEVSEQMAPILEFMDDKIEPIVERLDEIATTMQPLIQALIKVVTDPITANTAKLKTWIDKFKALLGFSIEESQNREKLLSELATYGIMPSYLQKLNWDILYLAAQKWKLDRTPQPEPIIIGETQTFGMEYLPDLTIRVLNSWYFPVADQYYSGKPAWEA